MIVASYASAKENLHGRQWKQARTEEKDQLQVPDVWTTKEENASVLKGNQRLSVATQEEVIQVHEKQQAEGEAWKSHALYRIRSGSNTLVIGLCFCHSQSKHRCLYSSTVPIVVNMLNASRLERSYSARATLIYHSHRLY